MTHKRMSDHVLSELYASCIAFSYGDEKLLLYTQDMVHTNAQWTAEVRSRIRESRHEETLRYILAFALIISDMSYYWRLTASPWLQH